MWYEVLQSDLIPINYMKRGERISIVQKNKIEDPEIYIHYYEASLSECRSLAICESRSLVPLHEEATVQHMLGEEDAKWKAELHI